MCSFAYAHFRCVMPWLNCVSAAVNEPKLLTCAPRLIINSDAREQLMKSSRCWCALRALCLAGFAAPQIIKALCRFTALKNSLIAYVWQVIM